MLNALVPRLSNSIFKWTSFREAYIYPALANAIIVFLMLILFFNKEKIIEAYHLITDFSDQPKILLKRKLLILLFTIMLMALVFAFDSLIELWFGASKEKII